MLLNFIQSVSSGIGNILNNDLIASGAISSTIYEVFAFATQKLPDGGGLPDGVHEGAIYFGNTLAKVNFILPVDVLVSCLVIILSLKITLFGFHIIMWVLNFIRGIATPRFDGNMSVGGGGGGMGSIGGGYDSTGRPYVTTESGRQMYF